MSKLSPIEEGIEEKGEIVNNPPAKFYRGELFDLTITTNNNVYGREKIDYSINNGIKFKLKYFLNELEKITKGKSDDKIEKRIKRKEFLEKCAKCQDYNVIIIFELLVKYLNGGLYLDNKKNEYPGQNFIIVLMGGNIINIYFKILYLIINNPELIKDISKIFDNNEMVGVSDKFELLFTSFKNWNETSSENELKKFINKEKHIFIAFSDLDFSLLPNNIFMDKVPEIPQLAGTGSKRTRPEPGSYNLNKMSKQSVQVQEEVKPKKSTKKRRSNAQQGRKTRGSKAKSQTQPPKKTIGKKKATTEIDIEAELKKRELQKKREEYLEKVRKNKIYLEKSNGFLLYRIKSNFSILDSNVISPKAQEIELFKSIIPQNNVINETYQSKDLDCGSNDFSALGIKSRKDLIAHLAQTDWLTKPGVNDKCRKFIKNLIAKKERTKLCTKKNTDIICNNDGLFELDDRPSNEIIKLTNIINYIRKITRTINKHLGELGGNYDKILTLYEVMDLYNNLYSILNNKNELLINICNSIVKKFYDMEETKLIVNNINSFYDEVNGKSNFFNVSGFNIYRYPRYKPIIFKEYKKNNNFLERKGTILTINLISSNDIGNKIVEEYENDDFNKLEKEFIYDQGKDEYKISILESERIERMAQKEFGSGKNTRKNRRKINALTRKCKNKKYRKKHTRKCKEIERST
jgi:hypothetical protein